MYIRNVRMFFVKLSPFLKVLGSLHANTKMGLKIKEFCGTILTVESYSNITDITSQIFLHIKFENLLQKVLISVPDVRLERMIQNIMIRCRNRSRAHAKKNGREYG